MVKQNKSLVKLIGVNQNVNIHLKSDQRKVIETLELINELQACLKTMKVHICNVFLAFSLFFNRKTVLRTDTPELLSRVEKLTLNQ